ncbi:acyl-CoA dehydrogenase family protein [Candidatus Poriferisocius sp.]|uniref:acyl-CoA dehydrogenase family protein n=1 Tax=Candidatus Poriferisocius sp. TaxID=3101276 RepID=UPI003B5A089F
MAQHSEDTPEQAAFRAEVQDWLSARAVRREDGDGWSTRTTHPDVAAEKAHMDRCRAWQRELYDGGWAAIDWPVDHGGRGGPRWQRQIFQQEAARFDVTSGFLAAGIALAGPAIGHFGTEEQKTRHLRPMLRGDVVWCQLFSEPGAGSDLANLGTRADRDGDEFVVNGQKVWNSSAHLSDWGILLARTDPEAPKHKGITFFLVDMHTAGVEPRPIRTINGSAHFNEVFLSDVRIPVDNVVGEVNGGWAVARLVLANESTMIGGGMDRADSTANLIALAQRRGRSGEPLMRQELARAYTREKLLDHMGRRMQEELRRGGRPSLDGSVLKVFWSESRRDRGDLGARLLGGFGVSGDHADTQVWGNEVLNRFWGSIGGGTDEVHRNNMAERVLGLPPEPRVDKHVPWRDQVGGPQG